MKLIRTIVQYIKTSEAKDGFGFRLVMAIMQFVIVLAFIIIIVSLVGSLKI